MSTIETTTSVAASGSSGATCLVTAPYFCSTHTDLVLFFGKGDKFSNCPISRNKKGHSTTWSAMGDAQATPISTADNLDQTAIG